MHPTWGLFELFSSNYIKKKEKIFGGNRVRKSGGLTIWITQEKVVLYPKRLFCFLLDMILAWYGSEGGQLVTHLAPHLIYIPQLHHIFFFKTASSLHQCFLYFFWSSLRRRADERKISDAARGLMVPAFSDFSAHFVRWMMTCKTFTSVSPNLQLIICGVREKISMIKIFLVLKCVIWYHS